MSKKSVFDERMEEYGAELRDLYMSLYHDEQAYEYFTGMLRRNHTERKASLRGRDLRSIEASDSKFTQDKLGMMLYTENYGGDLNGVRERLSYLKECGINYLHLMPLLDSPPDKSDGGYAVSDFRKVREDLGTMEDLEALTGACHRIGISVCLDFVMNHTSEEHEWARAARAGDSLARSRYFFYDNWDIPDQFSRTLPEVFPETAPGNYTYLDDCGMIVMTSFYPFQWDLNYANPLVFNDMTDNLLYLANRGIDVVRLDAVPYIWKALGTSCRNLPEVHVIVRMMNLACRIVCPSVMLLGEVVMEPKEVVPYFGTPEKPECDILYNVTTMCTIWHTLATRDVRLLRHQLEQLEKLPANCLFQNYIRCHDDIGWGLDYGYLSGFGMDEAPHKKYLNDWFTGKFPGSRSRGELYNDSEVLRDARLCGTTASLTGIETALSDLSEYGAGWSDELAQAVEADIMLHALMLTLSGIPVYYSGDEIGMLNDYGYHDDPAKREDSRNIHRGKFDWELAEQRASSETVAGRIFGELKKLSDIRKGSELFRADAHMYPVYTGDERVLGIVREYGGQTFLGLFNFSPEYCVTEAGGQGWTELAGGVTDSGAIWPFGFRWLVRDDAE